MFKAKKHTRSMPNTFSWLYLIFIFSLLIHHARAAKQASLGELVESYSESCGTLPEHSLHHAAEVGDVRAIHALLDRGADIEKLDQEGAAPLLEAVLSKQVEAVRALVNRGADVNINLPGQTLSLLHLAVGGHHLEMAKILIEAGALLTPNEHGQSLLMMMCWSGTVEIIEMLLARGEDPNYHLPNTEISTPITSLLLSDFFSIKEKTQILKLLINAKADLNFDLSQGMTYLHDMARLGRVKEIVLLLNFGMNINKQTKSHTSPLVSAIVGNEMQAATTLITALADVNSGDELADKPLTFAVDADSPEMVKLLLHAGAIFTIDDYKPWKQKSPKAFAALFDYAQQHGERAYTTFVRR